MSRPKPMLRWTAAVAVAVLALSSCSGGDDTAEPTPTPTTTTPSPTPSPTPEPTPEPSPTWVLTGVEVEEVEDRPAIAVKIENSDRSRPQSGLNSADVVWVQTVEGGATRFNAWFHSQLPEEIGPVRSARATDAFISGPLGGIQVYSGGRAAFTSAIRNTGLQTIDENGPGFYRTSNRRAPYNLYGNPADWVAAARDGNDSSPEQQFVFAVDDETPTTTSAGEDTASISLNYPFARPGWDWDADEGLWLRSDGGRAHYEATGIQRGNSSAVAEGDRISADNVVVLIVPTEWAAGTDAAGSRIPQMRMTGTGEALVASDGKSISATWSKESATDPLVLLGEDGDPIALKPGRTWVEMLPTGIMQGRYSVEYAAVD